MATKRRKTTKRAQYPDAHVNATGCPYFYALQKIGAKLDTSKTGTITSGDVREILEDTIRGDMMDAIIEPLPEEKARCANCDKVFPVSKLDEAGDLYERVEAGGEVPAGECPECGALAYEEDDA